MTSPDYYEFFSQQKVISGNRALESISSELGSMDAVKPLVIAGKGISKCLTKTFIASINDSNMTIGGLYNEVPDYANVATVNDLAELFRARGCDSIIGIGGGSVMNVAKGVNIHVSTNTGNIMDFKEEGALTKPLKPMVYIPLSYGDGLEATNSAVIDQHLFKSDRLFADVICIDPRMVKGCCAECVVEKAVIALTQAIESSLEQYCSPMNDAYAHSAIQLISENLIKGTKKLKNKKASMALANAAAFAGITYSNSPSGIVYMLSDALATLDGHPKGIYMGILLPYWFELSIKAKEKIREEFLLSMKGFDVFSSTPKEQRVRVAVDLLKDMLGGLKGIIPKTLKDLTIPKYRFNEVAERVVEKSNKRFTVKECLALLEAAYGE